LSPLEVLLAQSAPMQAWLAWMFAVNFSSVLFLRRVQARWAAAAMAGNLIAMQALVRLYGTGHHLALPHIVFWSPLLVYLFLQRRRILDKTPFGIWAGLLFATDAISLALDYASVFKWLIG
jgi:hypothetical protein